MANGKARLALMSPLLCALEHILAWWCGTKLTYSKGPWGTHSVAGFVYLDMKPPRVRLHGPACKFRVAALCHELGHVKDYREGRAPMAAPRPFTSESMRVEYSAWMHARKMLIAIGLWDTSVREYAHGCLESYRVTRRLPL